MKFRFHWSFFVLGLLMLIYGKITTFFWCLLCAILHEMGHSLVGKRYGYKLNVITLMPYGAMLSGANKPFSKSEEIKIAIAGPLVNVILMIVSLLICWIFPVAKSVLNEFVYCNLYTFCFNVLPVYPLDGGRVLLAILSQKKPYLVARKITTIFGIVITAIFFLLFFVSFFYNLNYMLGINALFLLIGLFGDDNNVYYEKLTTFDQFMPLKSAKTISIEKGTPLFIAYKKIVSSGASKVCITDKQGIVKKLTKNKILKSVTSLPIDTPIEVIN